MSLRPRGPLVAIGCLIAGTILSAQSARPFVLAAYFGGGLEPFARFTGSRWVNTWPAPDESGVPVPALERVPTTWLTKPVPRTWTLWPNAGVPRRIAVVGTRRGFGEPGSGCTQPAMLTVGDATGREETGLAVDNDQVLEQVREVEATSAEWRRLQPVVETTVRANERRLASIEPSNPAWQREVLATTHLFDAPLTVETLYRSASHTSPVLYYFEAVRTVSRTDGLSISAKVSGWLRPDRGGRLSAFALTGSVYDEEGMWSLTPLAVVRLAGRVFWITNVSHYESSEYVIRDVSPTAVRRVLTAYGGGC